MAGAEERRSTADPVEIRLVIGSERVSRDRVLAWESRRARVRHQFRDRDGGMEALLTVQFPGVFPARLIREHQWHLATEFSNWMIAAGPVAAGSSPMR